MQSYSLLHDCLFFVVKVFGYILGMRCLDSLIKECTFYKMLSCCANAEQCGQGNI